MFGGLIGYSDPDRCWCVGKYVSRVLGLADRQLRILGRYWSRRYADFCDSVFVPSELANEHQPRGRSHDDFRGDLCGNVPRHSRWSSLVGILVDSLSKLELVDVAAIPQSAAVGRVRSRYLRFGVAGVLVHGDDPRLGYLPRSFQSKWRRMIYGLLCLGWTGSSRHWMRYEKAYAIAGRSGHTAGFVGAHGG
jgi:hypothetical protein